MAGKNLGGDPEPAAADSQAGGGLEKIEEANAADQGGKLPDFKTDAFYRVQLSRPIQVGRSLVSPSTEAQLSGALCIEHKGSILRAEEIRNGDGPPA